MKPFITYSFKLEDGSRKNFSIYLKEPGFDLVTKKKDVRPEWTELGFHQCMSCTLDPAEYKCCPVASNITDLLDFLNDFVSHDKIEVTVASKDRTYFKRASMQAAAGSLMGIIMVTSGCPVLDRMRPMVLTHLPFPSWEETTYRFLSMYLSAQYFRGQAGEEPDWELEGLMDFIDEVEQTNIAFCARLQAAGDVKGEVSINAINILHSDSSLARLNIETDGVSYWRDVFNRFWL